MLLQILRNAIIAVVFLLPTISFGNEMPSQGKGMVYCTEQSISYANPQRYPVSAAASSLSYAAYDRLLNIEPETRKIIPGAGYLDHISADHLTYYFRIKRGILFQSRAGFIPTRPMNAEDVAFTFSRMLDPASPFYRDIQDFPYFAKLDIAQNLKSVKAENGLAVFQLKAPSQSLEAFLSMDNSVILSKEFGDFILARRLPPETLDYEAVGSGPYQQHKFFRERYIRFVPFKKAWNGVGSLPALAFTHSWQINKRLTQIMTGECQVISNPSASQMNYLQHNKTKAGIMHRNTVNGVFLIFNTKNSKLSNRHNRRAIASLINVEDLNEAVYYGLGHALKGYSINDDSITVEGMNQDEMLISIVELKRSPLELAVFDEETSGTDDYMKAAQLIKADLESHGIKVKIKYYRSRAGLRHLRNGQFDMAIVHVYSELDNMIQPMVSCIKDKRNSIGRQEFQNNFTGWCNAELDKDFTEIKKLKDNDPLLQIKFQNIMRILNMQMPAAPLIYSINIFVTSIGIKGITNTPAGGLDFSHAQYIQGEN